MHLVFQIALRYLFSKKKRNFINILSLLSLVGIAIGTFAMVIVLSAFNGFETLLRKMNKTVDADLKIETTEKYFRPAPSLIAKIKSEKGVLDVVEVIEENGLVVYKDGQMVVKFKGVSGPFVKYSRIKSLLSAGQFSTGNEKVPNALVSIGIQQSLGVSLRNQLEGIQLWYPKTKKNLATNPLEAFTRMAIMPSGIVKTEENFVFVPIGFAEKLVKQPGLRTSFEIVVDKNASIQSVKEGLKSKLGSTFQVLDSDEQHASLYKVMQLEKLFVFVALGFIVLISSFNIFVSLSMLALEKTRDIQVMQSFGTPANTIRQIFLLLGLLLAGFGAFFGMGFGLLVCYLQQAYGLVSLGMETTIIQSYPVEVEWFDFVKIGLLVTAITLLSTITPAFKASKIRFSKI